MLALKASGPPVQRTISGDTHRRSSISKYNILHIKKRQGWRTDPRLIHAELRERLALADRRGLIHLGELLSDVLVEAARAQRG